MARNTSYDKLYTSIPMAQWLLDRRITSVGTNDVGTKQCGNKSKPAIYKLYDFSEGRTDIIGQKMGFYSCKSKSKRWTMNAFSYVLDTCRVNTSTIYAVNNDLQPRNIKSVDFEFELAMSLIRPHIERPSLIGINSSVVRKIEIVLEKNILQTCKNVKCFFLINVKNEGDAMHVLVRLKEKEQKKRKTKFLSN